MNSAYGNSAYGNSNLASYIAEKTLAAEPLELVAMLYLKAITEIREARRHLAERNIVARSKAITKAYEVISELDASLNLEVGGDLAKRLRALYGYCMVRLLDANMQQADGPLAEVLGLLSTLSEGWQAIAKSDPAPERAPAPRWEVPAESPAGMVAAGISAESHSWTL
jgi:flagellar protein FliS